MPGLLAGLAVFSFSGFHLFVVPSHGVSVTFQAGGLFCTFVEAAVEVSCASISQLQDYSLPSRLLNVGSSEHKKKKKNSL